MTAASPPSTGIGALEFDERACAGEDPSRGGIDVVRRHVLGGGVEQGEVLGRTGEHLVLVHRFDQAIGQFRSGAGGSRRPAAFTSGARDCAISSSISALDTPNVVSRRTDCSIAVRAGFQASGREVASITATLAEWRMFSEAALGLDERRVVADGAGA